MASTTADTATTTTAATGPRGPGAEGPGSGGSGAGRRRLDLSTLLIEGRAFLALALIIVVFSLLSPNFLTVDNLLIMTSHVAIFALLSMGMLLVVLTGGIDLSVGSTLGFSAVIAGFLLRGVPLDIFGVTLYPSVPVAVLLSVGLGGLIGALNGVLVARFNVAPFVATLGMLYVVRGAALLMTNGRTINDLSGTEGLGNTGFEWLGFQRILGIPAGVLIMAAVALVLALVLARTTFGRWLYATGGNARAAELSGVPVRRVTVWVYVVSGLCSAIAGVILASTLTSASPTAGNTYELTAIAGVVIGGAALAGGRGTVRGTLLGAFVIGFLSDGLVLVGVSAYWQTVFIGAVIVVAVMLNSLQYGGPRRRARANAGKAPAAGSDGDAAPTGQGASTGQGPATSPSAADGSPSPEERS
ncbi:ABC transporter permease [Brachybacterium saurashtrense]|uniref:ABC transporter permease n=1 Tax=Brachybacterium saurashtrense TaxID=556288 RepID=A0A345YR20_9MICO|nr:ABC transporter permease [Brachybacterium saurashtrense]AXK46372.1 ABC transporter permease [Brachybacterium saurashtrense]RRR24112.1 ABC transporter permease [Brachybacterium saurashtrense]